MGKTEVVCPNCGTSFVIGRGGSPVTELSEGTHYLVPETIRNENVTKVNSRIEALKNAGIDVDKMQALMSSNEDFKAIFEADDPILKTIEQGGFIRNPELFRRWICAQTFALIGDGSKSWTYAVRKRYDTRYVFRQTKNELYLQLKLISKKVKNDDKRFTFFTLDDMKHIFKELAEYGITSYGDRREKMKLKISYASSLEQLLNAVNSEYWHFRNKLKYMPQRWLNCFKGAGAYYTLQNIIRTHGFIIPTCTDMKSSLDLVESMYKEVLSYSPSNRRWDMLMSLLMTSVEKTHFELKW